MATYESERRAEGERQDRDGARVGERVETIGRGMVGGALATALMTLYRMPATGTLPPTAEFWARYVGGGDPEDYPGIALALHFGYGIAAGGAFALEVLLPLERRERERAATGTDAASETDGTGTRRFALLGTVYGAVLSLIGEFIVLRGLLDIEPDDRRAFHVGHLIYGLALGVWAGLTHRN